MQARNIALVDLSVLRELESEALDTYLEREKTPLDLLLTLSAMSQMWVFSLYEFLRTWRQRAKQLVDLSEKYEALGEADKASFMDAVRADATKKQKFIRVPLGAHGQHVEKLNDRRFIESLVNYRSSSEELFRSAEFLRVTLAKHEVPKTEGFMADAPGYGRMSYRDGSIYWFISLKDGSQQRVSRRELANSFLGMDDDPI